VPVTHSQNSKLSKEYCGTAASTRGPATTGYGALLSAIFTCNRPPGCVLVTIWPSSWREHRKCSSGAKLWYASLPRAITWK